MLRTTYRGRAVREPVARSIHDDEADEVPRCKDCGTRLGVEGDLCLECALADGVPDADTREEASLDV